MTRLIAGAVDYAIVAGLTLGTYVGWGILRFLLDPRNFNWPQWPFGTFVAIGFCYLIVYLAIGWGTTGRTAGSRLMGTRVVDRHARALSPLLAILRAVGCAVVPVGLFWAAISAQNRSVQDVLLRTSVIYDWVIPAPPPEAEEFAPIQ